MTNESSADRPQNCRKCGALLIGNETRGEVCNKCLSAPQFVAIGLAVMRADQCEATARSHNMAKRIARALNLHKPNERGY
jgi:hypothetical protein